MDSKIIDRLNEFKEAEFKNIKKEETLCRNMPFAFTELGELGEELCLYMFPGSYGSASKGGCAFDNKEIDEEENTVLARESKVCSLNGSKECINNECKDKKNKSEKNKVGHKAPAFQKECIYCHKSDFKLIHDSRCGISTKPHIEWAIQKSILKEYILFAIKYNMDTASIYIHCWKIMSNNEYFKDYIINQHEKGSGGTCNCLPYSIDFHLSGPITLFKLDLYKDHNEIHSYNLSNMEPDNIPKYNYNTKNNLQYQYCDGVDDPFINTDSINYNENIHKFKYKSGKKNCLGKARGKTTRV
tara:strand:- start:162 stop:1061 length:900 start_codon:yes stop_codon:yes gene_type:complete